MTKTDRDASRELISKRLVYSWIHRNLVYSPESFYFDEAHIISLWLSSTLTKITLLTRFQFLLKAGFVMDDVQFKELCTVIKVGKSLSYQDFLDHFQRMNNDEYGEKMRTSWVREIFSRSVPFCCWLQDILNNLDNDMAFLKVC